MTAGWRSQRHQAVRVHQGQGWVPFHSQRTTMKGPRRMAVLVRQSIWKMVLLPSLPFPSSPFLMARRME
ncbi:unnamed protein product, partial [Gulo gulo]